MSVALTGRRAERKRAGLYIELHTYEEVLSLAKRSGLSFNETAHQLVEIGLEAMATKEGVGVIAS